MGFINAQSIRRRIVSAGFSVLGLSPSLWLDGQDTSTLFIDIAETTPAANTDLVGRWKDKSGNGHHADQATSGNKPTRDDTAINSHCGLVFNGANGLLASSPFAGLDQFEIWHISICTGVGYDMVYESYAGSNSRFVHLYRYAPTNQRFARVVGNGGTINSQEIIPANDSSGHLIRHKVDTTLTNTASQIEIDGSAVGATRSNNSNLSSVTMNTQDLSIGRRFDGSLNLTGKIGELIIIPRLLTTDEANSLFAYLTVKWGTTNLSGFTIDNLSPKIWLDGQDTSTMFTDTTEVTPTTSSDVIGRWKDKSGNNYHADQSTLANKPTLNTNSINSHSGLDCDATKMLVTPTVTLSGNTAEMWTVYKPNDLSVTVIAETPTNQILQFHNNASSNRFEVYASKGAGICNRYKDGLNTSAHIIRSTVDYSLSVNDSDIYVDGSNSSVGTTTDTNPTGTFTDENFTILARTGILYGLNGHFGEFIFFNRLLTTDEANLLTIYLKTKWSIP